MSEVVKVAMDGEVACLLLNRPDAFNAINPELVEALAERLISLASDDNVRGVVVSGEGKAFCAGGDLKRTLSAPQGPGAIFHMLVSHFHQAVLQIRRMSKPVIAAVNGVAAGGGFSLALACDFRVMAESAVLVQAYTSSGLCPDGGGTFTLPRMVGFARALEILAFDKPITAERALAWGLATRVVADGTALEEAVGMARELARRSLHSFGWAKRLITDSYSNPFEAHLEMERTGLVSCVEHPDGREGLRAFTEKRKPVFTSG
ncbi:enoyl-CoA hydratase/isomerase family protein [Syntrophobacter fumaroxidans]|uniref:Enoyl-CoA hydratase n=1 Tax=Syntrophobacter fumaroxidans (strain DSM 10017 / MPOB) TaxID=335543 RepID=A0LI34_SYNFM|nr:enoyl-CoA hydratase-related protein [Syntrophobacter fumaroxidans]ABK17086.1 Enoyl-CoA hydratase [Syntrophobacter fumaroxidans MPOB]